jgi:hypothetical protein
MSITGNGKIVDPNATVQEGRKKTLKDVQVSLRDQIVEKLRQKLIEQDIGEKIANLWHLGNADREKYLERQRAFLMEFDEFIDPIYPTGTDWGSALHLPIALTVGKTFHARMLSALLGVDPPFNVKAQKDANAQRAPLIQDLMRYAVIQWANRYKGVANVADRWLWNWVMGGCGILKSRWITEYSRYMDVENQQIEIRRDVVTDPQTGEKGIQPVYESVEKEVERTIKCYDCPAIERVSIEDLLIVGGEGDPQCAEAVIQQSYMTSSELWTLVDQKIFNSDAVDNVVKSGRNMRSSDSVGQVQQMRSEIAGESQLDKPYEEDKYQILECYLKVDVDGSGITSDVVVWIHKQTREVLRATYLYRISPYGRRPYYKIDFHKREGATYGVGIVELLYSLSKEIDAIHNIRMDIGILTSQPIGFYRPTAAMSEQKLPIEPGALIPLDNPQADVFFPNLGNRTSFAFQEEASLMNMIERLSSINEITLGVIGGQGATRTATGTRALVQETNANLDVFIRRMNEGWKGILEHTFMLLQQKIEPGFQFRLLGDDGQNYWTTIKSREEIKGMYDFILEPNSSQSNRQMQIDIAQQVYQLTANPIDLQLGIVTPVERYEALKNLLQQFGVKDFSRFIRKPEGGIRWTPEQLANLILSGAEVKIDPTQDLQGFIDYVQHIFEHDELLGQFNEQQTVQLALKMQEAQQLLMALQAQQSSVANIQQQRANSQQMTAPSEPVATAAPQPSLPAAQEPA